MAKTRVSADRESLWRARRPWNGARSGTDNHEPWALEASVQAMAPLLTADVAAFAKAARPFGAKAANARQSASIAARPERQVRKPFS